MEGEMGRRRRWMVTGERRIFGRRERKEMLSREKGERNKRKRRE